MKITEGSMPFLGYHTWYRIVEEPGNCRKPPLLLLHGGPGSTHNYMELLDSLCLTGRPVISYDQIGCGNSYLDGHPELWKMETWVQELQAIRDFLHLDRLHILGQSWGGMLLQEYLIHHSQTGVCSAILSSTLPSSQLWSSEQHRMIRFLSEADQQAIAQAEASSDFQSPAYLQANKHFMERHCASDPEPSSPECLRRPSRPGSESYLIAWGPNEYTPNGTLRSFDVISELSAIHVPSLIISGTDDLCTPLIAKTMADGIPNAQWELFPDSRHMCFADQQEHYLQVMRHWLTLYDAY